MISKASAAGMPLLSPQGWVHGDFAFTLLSLSLPPDQQDNLLASSGQISLSLPPDQPDNLLTLCQQLARRRQTAGEGGGHHFNVE